MTILMQTAAPEVTMLVGYLRTTEVAKRLGISTRTVVRWIEQGFFPGAFKVNPNADNSPYMIPVSDVEVIEQKRREGGETLDG